MTNILLTNKENCALKLVHEIIIVKITVVCCILSFG